MFLYIFLLSVVSLVISEEQNCDVTADRNLEWINARTRTKKATVVKFSSGKVAGFHYSKVFLTGCDSLRRTGPCTMETSQNCTTYDTHLGLGLAVLTIPDLEFEYSKMSAFAISRNNSAHYRITICKKPCKVTVHALELEMLNRIDFHTSERVFNYVDLKGLFYREGWPLIQKKLDGYRKHLEKEMKHVCQNLPVDRVPPQDLFP